MGSILGTVIPNKNLQILKCMEDKIEYATRSGSNKVPAYLQRNQPLMQWSRMLVKTTPIREMKVPTSVRSNFCRNFMKKIAYQDNLNHLRRTKSASLPMLKDKLGATQKKRLFSTLEEPREIHNFSLKDSTKNKKIICQENWDSEQENYPDVCNLSRNLDKCTRISVEIIDTVPDLSTWDKCVSCCFCSDFDCCGYCPVFYGPIKCICGPGGCITRFVAGSGPRQPYVCNPYGHWFGLCECGYRLCSSRPCDFMSTANLCCSGLRPCGGGPLSYRCRPFPCVCRPSGVRPNCCGYGLRCWIPAGCIYGPRGCICGPFGYGRCKRCVYCMSPWVYKGFQFENIFRGPGGLYRKPWV